MILAQKEQKKNPIDQELKDQSLCLIKIIKVQIFSATVPILCLALDYFLAYLA